MNATPAIRYSADELAADLAGRTAALLGDIGAGLPGDVLGYAVARVSGGQVFLTSASVLSRAEAGYEAGQWKRAFPAGVAVCEIRRVT